MRTTQPPAARRPARQLRTAARHLEDGDGTFRELVLNFRHPRGKVFGLRFLFVGAGHIHQLRFRFLGGFASVVEQMNS